MIQETKKILSSDNGMLRAFQYVVFGSVILYFGREIFVPLCFAALVSFVLYPVCAWMERRGVGRAISIAISVGVLTIILFFLTSVLAKQFVDFAQEWPALQPRISTAFEGLREFLVSTLGISREAQDQWLSKALDSAASGTLKFIKDTISVSAFSTVMAILIPVYVVLILYYRSLWRRVLVKLLPTENTESVTQMLSLTIEAYYNFIKGMGVVYLAVAVLNSLGLYILGVPHAILFGSIASVLTFIPYVGILAGSLLPITVAWATYDSVWYPVGVIGVFAFVQYLEANVIFPFAVSNRLKVNTLVVIIAIFVGGLLWGVAGMILFVPFVGILKLIADHNPRLVTISMLLGTGNDQPAARKEQE